MKECYHFGQRALLILIHFSGHEIRTMCTRLFLAGVIALLLGVQFRYVDTFVLNERVSRMLNERKQVASAIVYEENSYAYDDLSYSDYDDPSWESEYSGTVARREITPPRWLGWSLISVGAVLILTCPCFR